MNINLLITNWIYSSSNPFTYLALAGLSDAGAVLLGIPAVKFLPRKFNMGGGNLIAGLLILSELAIPDCKFIVKYFSINPIENVLLFCL